MLKIKSLFLFYVILVGFTNQISAQQVFPVQTNSQLLPPNSLYVEDYFSPGGNQWQINLNFVDFAEPYRDVKLHLKIEGQNIILETKQESVDPALIFTLIPGQQQIISGSLLEPYFNASNMNLAGLTWNQLSQNGRLPEGFYTFCVEVVDVYSGEVLSSNSCNSAWLRLNDQPLLNTPYCGQVLPTNVPLNVLFQWQANNLLSANPLISTEYQLTLFEVTDLSSPPINAVSNGNVIQVFQSAWVSQNSFLYDLSAPSLDVGKCYAYMVQAKDVGGRDLFKNNGFSEVCWLYYGYPDGGIVPLIEPIDSAGFSKFQRQYFKWDGSQTFLPSQPISYEITIVEVESNQTSTKAVQNNTPFHKESFPVYYGGTGYDFELLKQNKTFVKGKRYAWQVKANSNGQEVAVSPVYTFLGAPIVDEFYVNNHKVEVVSLSTSDLNSLSGVGRVALDALGQETALMNFQNISLIDYGGVFFLSTGGLYGEVETSDSVLVNSTASLDVNADAKIYFKEVKLSNATDLNVKGRFLWEFPLITSSPQIAILYSDQNWLGYTGYKINGDLSLGEDYQYALLEPYGFNIQVDGSSQISVVENDYSLDMNGWVQVPAVVKGYDQSQRVKYLFENQSQLFYMQDNLSHYMSNIIPVGEMNVRIEPSSYTIDLSDALSPAKFQDQLDWKGVYLNNFDLKFNTTNYNYSSLQFTADITKSIDLNASDSTKGWIGQNGFSFLVEEDFTSNQSVTYNTFPGMMEKMRLEVYNSSVSNSYLEGHIKIPFLSAAHEFGFTVPMTVYGYNEGYLNESIDSTEFVFNQGAGQNEMFITVNRAVFADNQKLIMNVSLDWPGLEVSIPDADGFMIWGNYNIGFGQVNGVYALQNEVTGVASNNAILARNIGAGRDANLYSLGLNGEMMMGEDVAGDEGAPVFNAYSIYESPLIAENYTPGTLYNFGPSYDGNYSNGESSSGGFTFGDTTNSDLAFAMNSFGNALSNNGSGQTGDGSAPDSIPLPGGHGDTWEPQTAGEVLEKIVYFIDLFSPFMPEDLQAKAAELKLKLETLESSELFEIYEELEKNGFDLQKILKAQVDKLVVKMTDKISAKMDVLNVKIENAILNPVDSLVGKANHLIEEVIDGVAEQIIQMVGDMEGVANVLQDASDATKMEITTAISTSIHNSVKVNVTDKITGFIDTVFTQRVNQFLAEEITKLGYAIIDGETESISLDGIANNAGQALENIGNDIVGQFKSISMEGVKNTCKDIVDDAVDGIDWSQIGENIKNKVMESATDEVIDAIVGNIVGQFGDTLLTNSLAANLTENFEFDFSNLGEKIQNGDIGSIVKFDPTKIKIQSKVVDLEGMIVHLEDDPDYGDCWMANLNVNVHKPKEISAYAKYINGKIDDYNYWFVEVAIDKGLNIPFVGGLALDGIGGKVFKHMKYVRNDADPLASTYFPNDSVNFGVGVMLWMIDAATGGETVKLKVGAEVVIMDEGFEMSIRGNVAVKSKDNAKEASFDNALVSGEGFVSYSTITNHFIGQFNVNANVSPLICGGGQLGMDIQPGEWSVYVGKKINPIQIKLLCKDPLLVESWFEVTNTTLQFGIQSQFDFYAQSPWFKIGRYWRPYAGFGWDFFAELNMSYKPSVVIHNAQVYMSVYASLGVDWERRNGDGDAWDSGNITLFSVGMAGNLQYSQNTSESRFQGSLAGHVTIFAIGVDFDVNVNKTM